jgi:hypothetical protein
MTRLRLFEPGPAEELLKLRLDDWRHTSHDPWLHVLIDHVRGTFDAYFEDTSSSTGSATSWDIPERTHNTGKIIKGRGFSVKPRGQKEGYDKAGGLKEWDHEIRVLRPTNTDIWIHRIRKWCEMSNSKLLTELRKIALEYQGKEQRAVGRFIKKANAKRAKELDKQRRDKKKNKSLPKTSKKPSQPVQSVHSVHSVESGKTRSSWKESSVRWCPLP